MTPAQPILLLPPSSRSVETVFKNRWARLAIPSFSDLFFLAILVWLFVSGGEVGWSGLLADGDTGWHIRTGEFILDNATVPRVDLYSFSREGAPWFAWEWLSDVIAASLHRVLGLKGVVLLAAIVLSVHATTLIRRMIWRGVHPFIAMLVTLFGIGASTIHFLARPHIFTLLLLSITVWLIEADRARRSRHIWWLVPITAAWTNLHGGFLAIVAVLALTVVGTVIETQLGQGRTIRDVWRYTKLTVFCALASLVNPYGWHLHRHVIEYLRSDWIREVVQEFQSPSFRTESMLQYEALLMIGIVVAALLLRRYHVVEALWILFWAHMSLGSVRHVPVFVAVCVPAIAAELSSWWATWTAKASKVSLAGVLNQIAFDSIQGFRRTSLLPFAVAVGLVAIRDPIRWPDDFPQQLFPTTIVRKNADLLARSRVLTTDQWADYLIYCNPQQKVFVDGRSDFYGATIGKQYVQVLNGHWRWREWMRKYDFNVALVPVSTAISQLLKQEPGWRTLADDGKQILLGREGNLRSTDAP